MPRQTDDSQQKSIEDIAQQFVDARMEGQEPDVDEFVKKYPQFGNQLRQMILNIRKIDTLFHSLVQTDEIGFENAADGQNLIGQKIGSFEIVEMIGRGGMGVVYLARDTTLKRSVAIKSVPTALSDDSATRTRFRREAELLASLNHPNIAVIYEIIQQDGAAGYLVLEHVPGETLSERIDREPLKIEETLSIGRQIAEAVSAAHEKGVVHRDLKPGNIKITPDGRVKVLDFGLAKSFTGENKSTESTETQPGRMIGTPAYMSPEQARGKETDHRTDIWSFGCIIYQMLTGRLPFEGETSTDILACIIEREPDWELLPQDTPTNVRTLLRRCLEKDMDKRLEDISDVILEISETLPQSVTASVKIIADKSRRKTMLIGAIIVIVLTGAAIWFGLSRDTESSAKVIRLVVLPFENLGSADDEDYSSAISAEIISRLVGIRGLAVSSGEIAENRAMLMGKQLGIDYVLKGTIQCVQLSDPNSPLIRVRPQLIRVSDGQYVWAEPYDKEMSQIHKIPSELAEQVATALNVTLPKSEPIIKPKAYIWYMRGNEYFHRSFLESDLMIAIRMYQNAIELDPTFALAYAQLSRAHAVTYWIHGYGKEHLSMAKKNVEKAIQLNPDLPEIRLALGHYYYHCLRNYEEALEQFAIARQSMPNSSELLSLISAVQRRQGKLRQALVTYKKAYDIDPFSNILAVEIANTLTVLREYPEAERFYTQGILLAPDVPMPYHRKALLYLFWEGRTEKAWAVLEEALENAASAKEEPRIVYLLVMLNVYDGNYEEALTQLSSWPDESFDIQRHYIPKALLYARIHGLMGNRQLEQTYYESAQKILETRVCEDPNDHRFHSSLGMAYAGLNQKENAIMEGKKGGRTDLAHIYVMIGDYNAAIDQLEILLSKPGELSIPFLRLDPSWNPLRTHPRFQKLLKSGN